MPVIGSTSGEYGTPETSWARAPIRQFVSAVEAERQHGTLGHGAFEHLLLEREERLRHSLVPSRTLVKVGPSMGLLGTLIPMGTSLASLATGNLEAMAGQMVVAFTTTIIGLATGTLAYVVAATRQGWVNESIREQRFLAERIALELDGDDTSDLSAVASTKVDGAHRRPNVETIAVGSN